MLAWALATRVACGRYGGPIAMVRDDRKLVVVTGGLTKPVVRIYTAAGQAMAAFVWDHGRIAALGWTSEEDLLILEDSGEVCLIGHAALTNCSMPCRVPMGAVATGAAHGCTDQPLRGECACFWTAQFHAAGQH